jgi:methyl-accepting chemotaxis protein
MNIRQTSLAVALLIALFFILTISYQLYDLYQTKNDSENTRLSIESSSILNKAIIELSLERSVMQVTLNLNDKIQPAFKKLLDLQRDKSNQGFEEVINLVLQKKNFRRAKEFVRDIKILHTSIEELRNIADKNLILPLAQRNKEEVINLPTLMKKEILEFSLLPLELQPENLKISTDIINLKKIQYHAWEVREYSGRERTYLAIATATGRSFTEVERKKMEQYNLQAEMAMKKLKILSGYQGLNKDVIEKIKEVKNIHFGSYDKIRKDIFNAAKTNKPYPITFDKFFKLSSEALDTAVNLSYLAGDKMMEHVEGNKQKTLTLFNVFVMILVLVIFFCGFQIYYTQFKVSNRILKLANFMQILTKGNTDIELAVLSSSDEIGQMAKHVEIFRKNVIEVRRLEEEQKQQQRRAEEAKKQTSIKLANQFEDRIGAIVNSVRQASQEMQNMSLAIANAITKSSAQSLSVAHASQETSTNVQSVAAAAEQMSTSIQEISRDVKDTAQKAKECAGSAEISQEKLSYLQKAIDEIDSVIQAINNVATQTNLLALNATIEAARAGDAGRGFAVVASEVKSLASETHKMTEEIAKKVEDVKSSAAQTIDYVNNIISQINAVDKKTTNVATAIEQQSSATTEISKNVVSAATSIEEVSTNIENIQKSATNSVDTTENLKIAADDLFNQANNLKEEVDSFLKDVRNNE